MFTVIHNFDVRPGREQEFLDAWALLTREFIRSRGCLGSRMHRDKHGRLVAIAIWPDRAAWEAKPTDPAPELVAARQTMMKACELFRTEAELETVMDLWVNGLPDRSSPG
ncbi:MAG TPA: antibiotic biosynthesis monooxygenase [Flavobacteriales bacterium]|nr:antibiotic biosynthesis monooxygenase [Flavobacteriales bacterium]MCC6654173.1 antibiotic biosynthesis monooxygenase [Flavobacteriales bacterium]HMW97738.1 antibiotic biosynthesis monooxygenase [Flavobacteriales bacterium]HMZ47350.1 antibiotic biosynthesis monooxygenase [Flavobacteriales bacterium]HNE81033.1 antibiotic biosynthesis monooxygenase [Flavobacteriales bacterium]